MNTSAKYNKIGYEGGYEKKRRRRRIRALPFPLFINGVCFRATARTEGRGGNGVFVAGSSSSFRPGKKSEGKLRDSDFTEDVGSSLSLNRGLFISLVDRVDGGRRAKVE